MNPALPREDAPRRMALCLIRGSASRGFALVITLALMILLVLLAVGLLSLSSISLRSSSQGLALAEARANARLGLMMALGELQQQLGPDQRISAEAGLRHDGAASRSHWLGAYHSWLDTEENRPSPTFLRWLVSGKPDSLKDESTAEGGNVAARMVRLVDRGTVGDSANVSDRVEAGVVDVLDKSGYAWWVSDENGKVRIPGSSDPPAEMVNARAELMCAPQTGIQGIPPFENIQRTSKDLDKTFTVSSLDLLHSGAAGVSNFHHVTTDSRSLITNVRKGGFRKDLSMELERNERQRPTQPLYTTRDGKRKGIDLGELWDYYNLWKELSYPSRVTHQDGGSVGGIPFLESELSHVAAVEDPFYTYKRLTVLRSTWVVSLMTLKENATAKSHQLYMVLDPILTVWNPFDVAIRINRSAFQGFKYWGIPYRMELTVGTDNRSANINSVVGNNFFMHCYYGRNEDIVLRPGEVLVISQGTKSRTDPGNSGMITDLKLGWNFGSGFRYKIPNALAAPGSQIKCDLVPRPDAHMGVALVEFLHYQGSSQGAAYTPQGIWLGGLMVDRALDIPGPKLQATDLPKYFPRLPAARGRILTMGSIENEKQPLMLLSLDTKTEMDPIDEGLFQGRSFLHHNPKLPAYDIKSFDPATLATWPLQISVKALNSWKDQVLDVGASGQGYAGGDYTAQFGTSRIVTQSIPREPIISLAAFQNSVANGNPNRFFGDHTLISKYFLYPSISHAIGNSFAQSFIAPYATEGQINDSVGVDHSYLANLALWDDWFLSSIAPQTSQSWQDAGSQRNQRIVFEEFLGISGKEPKLLPNQRLRPWVGDPQEAVNAIFSGSAPRPDAAALIGSKLMIEGGFNVNSVSVPAWKAFLNSMKDASIPMIDGAGPEKLRKAEGVPSAALLTAAGPAIPDNELDDPSTPLQWRGFRQLDDYQIDELAKALVAQIRKRGPFLSLADFINRRPGSDRELALSGALQAALDDKSVSINRDYTRGARAVPLAATARQGLAFPEAETGAAAVGIPGYVKQADLLTPLGSLLSVRGDSFRIRAYGESRSRDGRTVLARAYCEAVVQRVPDYLDSIDEPEVLPQKLRSTLNQRFGRRIQVVSFRWLGLEEI